MGKVTYIIPIHKFDESAETLLPNALTSIKDTKKDYTVILVGPEDVLSKTEPIVEKLKMKTSVKYVKNEGKTDFASQVNAGAFACTTKYFCVVEYDDAIMEYWPKVAEDYQNDTGAKILIPLVQLVKNGEFAAFANEIAWSAAFGKEDEMLLGLGHLDIDQLNIFMDFNVTGAFINTEDFISIGGLKPSLKVAAWYEFLLRACQNGLDVYVVPKLGYSHTIWRDGSYMSESAKDISKEEGTWLIETARQEYFFKKDREKKFGE